MIRKEQSMTRFFVSLLAVGLCAAAISENSAQAQTLIIGRNGVQYNGYGQGYYGGYGQGYNGDMYVPGANYRYSNYGNGPYGYDSRNSRMYPAYGGYNYGNTAYYNGYGYSGGYQQDYAPIYTPFGFGVYSSYGW
jgi:hypothetical protein